MVVPSTDYTSDSGRSRNNSGASTNSNSTISSKSPRTVTTVSFELAWPDAIFYRFQWMLGF